MILQVLKGTGCIGGEKLFGRLFEQDISESNHLNNIGESDAGVAERSEASRKFPKGVGQQSFSFVRQQPSARAEGEGV